LQVRLYRDSFATPWGFRLQGGKDLKQPLVVQRVSVIMFPAEGQLQRGDIIDSIGIKRGVDLSHKQAQDSLKHGGGQIELAVTSKYGGGGPTFGAEFGGTPASMPTQSGNYRPVEQYNMLNKVQGTPRLVPYDPPTSAQPHATSNNTYNEGTDPNVVHLQYNSPMGLYSNDKVQETIDSQS
ncbi:hypothetical protein LOTGIDRAFT_95070, partial [Lottia gigantea]